MQGYQEIGQILTRAREERQMSVIDVGQVLHIRPRYIEALESGDFSIMPSVTYTKGYLKRYVSYLSLDIVEILRRFELATEQSSSSFFMPHSFSHEKRIDVRLGVIFLCIALFFMLLWAIWLRPAHTTASLVEPVPENVMEPETAAPAPKPAQQVACAGEQKALYPPCYWQEPEPTPSIMRLTIP